MPVYGVEMRGGTANCTVVVSDGDIGSPIIQRPVSSIVMNKPSLEKFGPRVKKDGFLFVNSSLIEADEVNIEGPEILMVPTIELAKEAGNDRLANMVVLGALAQKSGVTGIDSLVRAMEDTLPERARKMIPVNTAALEKGAAFIKG
jgi:2-oxoglutarate ferredoxin oxidoreductase subunit gamma